MEAFYIGVDFHPHQQTVAWCELQTGEIKTRQLLHNTPAVKEFYASMPPAIVGVEASTNAVWFEALLSEHGHQLRIGNPSAIRARARSRHKSDKRDAELLLDLLRKPEFPTLWRRQAASQQVLDFLHLRNRFVRQRTQTYNRLQALAHSCGLPKGHVKTRLFKRPCKLARSTTCKKSCARNSTTCWSSSRRRSLNLKSGSSKRRRPTVRSNCCARKRASAA